MLDVRTGAGTTGTLLSLQNTSAAAAGNIVPIRFYSSNTFGGLEQTAAIWGINPNAGANNGGALVLAVSDNGTATTPTERMRITAAGRVGIFTSSPSGSVSSNFVHIDGQTSGLRIGPCFPASNGSTDRDFLEILPGGTTTTILAPNEVFLLSNPGGGASSWETDVISGTGGVKLTNGATSWAAITSDRRKKKNFEPSQGLAEVLQIESVKYHFEWDDDSIPKRMGFIAQNIQPLIPEMVSTTREKAPDGSDYLTITPDYILPVLVKAIQELNAEIEILKNK